MSLLYIIYRLFWFLLNILFYLILAKTINIYCMCNKINISCWSTCPHTYRFTHKDTWTDGGNLTDRPTDRQVSAWCIQKYNHNNTWVKHSYIQTQTQTHTYMYTFTNLHKITNTDTPAHLCTHASLHSHTHTWAHIHPCLQTPISSETHFYKLTNSHSRKLTPT